MRLICDREYLGRDGVKWRVYATTEDCRLLTGMPCKLCVEVRNPMPGHLEAKVRATALNRIVLFGSQVQNPDWNVQMIVPPRNGPRHPGVALEVTQVTGGKSGPGCETIDVQVSHIIPAFSRGPTPVTLKLDLELIEPSFVPLHSENNR